MDIFFRNNNPCSDIRLRLKKSADVIVPQFFFEGRTERKESINFVLLMEERRKQSNLSEDKNYQQEVEVEPQGNVGERSYSKAETERRDELNEDDKLPEQILSKANMNLAYEQVKKNAGSAGIDQMKTEELLKYLKIHGEALLNDLLTGRYSP